MTTTLYRHRIMYNFDRKSLWYTLLCEHKGQFEFEHDLMPEVYRDDVYTVGALFTPDRTVATLYVYTNNDGDIVLPKSLSAAVLMMEF